MISRCFISIVLLLCFAIASNAFTAVVTPSQCQHHVATTTSLSMKFMKDLGFEKPSWLPDFGGKKESEDANAADSAAPNSEEKAPEAEVAATSEE